MVLKDSLKIHRMTAWLRLRGTSGCAGSKHSRVPSIMSGGLLEVPKEGDPIASGQHVPVLGHLQPPVSRRMRGTGHH